MSTRSIIVVTGLNSYGRAETVRIYKHSDGYPTGNLPVLRDALKRGLDMVREHEDRFKEISDRVTPFSPDMAVGLIIGESTSVYGRGADIDDGGESPEPFKPKHLGNQWDLEWIYVVDLQAKTLMIYGGGYTGNAPQEALKKGPVDPMKYAKQLKAEYQDKEAKEIAELVQSIELLGFKVNPKSKRKPRSKWAKAKLELAGSEAS